MHVHTVLAPSDTIGLDGLYPLGPFRNSIFYRGLQRYPITSAPSANLSNRLKAGRQAGYMARYTPLSFFHKSPDRNVPPIRCIGPSAMNPWSPVPISSSLKYGTTYRPAGRWPRRCRAFSLKQPKNCSSLWYPRRSAG